MKGKYPIELFVFGFILDLIKNFYLLAPGIILTIIGVWNKTCLYIGLSLLIIDIIIPFVEQLQKKRTCETDDSPNFLPWKNAILDDN